MRSPRRGRWKWTNFLTAPAASCLPLTKRCACGVAARAIVTYKGPAERQRYKSREEIEFDISSAEAFLVVLDRLGYRPGFRCEKYRSKFADMPGADRNEAGVITIDETPVGVFLELEGQKDWIDSTAARLGFTADDYLTMSYAALYQRFRESHPQSPIDMLFL